MPRSCPSVRPYTPKPLKTRAETYNPIRRVSAGLQHLLLNLVVLQLQLAREGIAVVVIRDSEEVNSLNRVFRILGWGLGV